MKKMIFSIIAFFFTLSLFSTQMSLGIAQTVAQNWYSLIYETEKTTIDNYSIETIKGLQTAFIFNFSEGGFVITSTSNDAEPILAYNNIGGILTDRSPGLEWLISCYNDQVFEIIDDNLFYQTHRDTWSDLYANSYTENRTEVVLEMDPTWHQGPHYNNFVPMIDNQRCVTGCAPTAMAQIINYHKYMSDYTFSNGFATPNYSFSIGDPYNLIIKIDEDATDYGFPTFVGLDDFLLSVKSIFNSNHSLWFYGNDDDEAALAFGCGIAFNTDYGLVDSGAIGSVNAVNTYAQNFGYKATYHERNTYQGNWETLLKTEIDQDRPIHYGGTHGTQPETVSHAFIIHGYSIDSTTEPNFFHVNWGWGHGQGSSDGWYNLDDLSPNANSYINSQNAIINIEPASLTVIGELSAYSPERWGDFSHPISTDVVAYYDNGSGIIEIEGEYRGSTTGNYYIQFDEQLPIGTEFWITFEYYLYDEVTVYDEITSNSNVHYMEPIELFWKVKPLYSGWNWESFPILDRTGNDPVDAITVLEEMEGYPEDILAISVLNNGPIGSSQGYGELYYESFEWNPLENYNLQSTRCFKIEVLPGIFLRILDVPGTLLEETTNIDLLAGQDNWIGYWIKETQDINYAFGNDWEKIKSVKAEDWEWKDMSNNRGLEPAYYTVKPLNYGKGYVVRVKEDIIGFEWNVSGEPTSQYSRHAPENFTFEEKPDYESVIIDTIEGGNNIVEIGVFENDVCIGAAVVDEFPLQVLAYTDAINRGGDLSFQFSYGNSRGYQAAESYSVLNLDTGNFESRSIVLGELEHNILQLHVNDEQEIVPEIQRTVLHSNYPNPFNPTTQISFSVPQEGKINLSIYNIKGQLVKTLINRRIVQGSQILHWNGKDNAGKHVSSGVYFYKLKTHDKEISKKMLLLK